MLAPLLALLCALGTLAAGEEIQVVKSGKYYGNVEAYRVEDYFYLGAAEAAKVYGGQRYWFPAQGRVQLSLRGRQVAFTEGAAEANVDGKTAVMPRPLLVRLGHAFIPVEFFASKEFADLAGVDSSFNPKTRLLLVDQRSSVGPLRWFTYPDHTRVVLELRGDLRYQAETRGLGGFEVGIPNGTIDWSERAEINDGVLESVHLHQDSSGARLAVRLQPGAAEHTLREFPEPRRLVLDFARSPELVKAAKDERLSLEAPPPPGAPSGERSTAGAYGGGGPLAAEPAAAAEAPRKPQSWKERIASRKDGSDKPAPSAPGATAAAAASAAGAAGAAAGASAPAAPSGERRTAGASEGGGPLAAEKQGPAAAATPVAPAPAPEKPAGPRYKIMIDAGHGGKDGGTVGRRGTLEKDINLAVAKELSRLLEEEGLFEVRLTRDDDTFVKLGDRTRLANSYGANLFVSLHGNAHSNRGYSGYEVYVLSERASDPDAERLAEAENSVLALEGAELPDAAATVLYAMAKTEFINDALELAGHAGRAMSQRVDLPNRGVKQAAFFVLRGAECPAVLIEMGYLSNAQDEAKLQSEKYRRKIVEGIYAGIVDFARRKGWRTGVGR